MEYPAAFIEFGLVDLAASEALLEDVDCCTARLPLLGAIPTGRKQELVTPIAYFIRKHTGRMGFVIEGIYG